MTASHSISISIITVCLNSEATIADCLASLHSQTHPFEHIIVDGGSVDRTLQIIEQQRTPNCRLISEPDGGMYDAMNKGLAMAGGDVVGLLNGDDCYADSRVLADVASAFAEGGVDSCYGDLLYVDRHHPEKIIRRWRSGRCSVNRWYWGYMVPHPTFFVRRSYYRSLGGFKLDLGSAADYELMLRFLVKAKLTTRYLPRVLIRMKVGGVSNRSLRHRLMAHLMDRRAWAENGLQPYPWTLVCKPLRKLPQWFVR